MPHTYTTEQRVLKISQVLRAVLRDYHTLSVHGVFSSPTLTSLPMNLATEMMRQMEVTEGQAKISLPFSGNGIIIDLIMYRCPARGEGSEVSKGSEGSESEGHHKDTTSKTVVFVLHHAERIKSYVPVDHATKRKRTP